MKKRILLVLSLGIIITGCEKNIMLKPEINQGLKSAEVKMVPIKGNLQSKVTHYQEGVPVIGTLSGEMSHLGLLVAENSIWNTISLGLDEITWTITWEMSGIACAANGDHFYYTLSGDFIIPENMLTAHAEIDGGTGRFEDAAGYLDITGYADDPLAITVMYMHAEGYLSSVGSKN
jgi:hypothetical protein